MSVSSGKTRKSLVINASLLCISCIMGLYFVETGLFIMERHIAKRFQGLTLQEIKQKLARAADRPFDGRSVIEVMDQKAQSGSQYLPAVYAHQFINSNGLQSAAGPIFPFASISHTNSIFCNESGQYITYQSDEHGFRNPSGLHRPGAAQIALIGDSFTQGYCLEEHQTIAGRLNKLTGKTILNLGMRASGPLLEYAVFREYAKPSKPKTVFWLYFEGNDFIDLKNEQTSAFLQNYLKSGFSQMLIQRQGEVDSVLKVYLEGEIAKQRALESGDGMPDEEKWGSKSVHGALGKWIKLYRIRNHMRLTSSGFKCPEAEDNFEDFINIIAQARDRVTSWGGGFYFVYLPDWSRYNTRGIEHHCYLNRFQVIEAVGALGIPLIDIHTVFQNSEDPLSLFSYRDLWSHYNAEGYNIIAQEIALTLSTQQN